MKSLYEITGDIKDINMMIVPLADLKEIYKLATEIGRVNSMSQAISIIKYMNKANES